MNPQIEIRMSHVYIVNAIILDESRHYEVLIMCTYDQRLAFHTRDTYTNINHAEGELQKCYVMMCPTDMIISDHDILDEQGPHEQPASSDSHIYVLITFPVTSMEVPKAFSHRESTLVDLARNITGDIMILRAQMGVIWEDGILINGTEVSFRDSTTCTIFD